MNDANGWRMIASFEIPSQPGNERKAMEQVAEIVRGLNLPVERLERLKTAVAEATMNAMEHGNHYRPDLPTTIEILTSDGKSSSKAAGKMLVVKIRDYGGGEMIPESEAPDLEAKLAGLQSPRGWGLFLIKNMVDEMRVTADRTSHTIELILYLDGDGAF